MRDTIVVEDYEDKKTKANKRYTRFKTNKGWMSCFESSVAEQLKKLEKQEIAVEIQTSGDFKNIKQVYTDTQTEDQAEVEVVRPGETEVKSTDRVDRAKALELAITYVQNTGNNSVIYKVANEYFNYITTGQH
jgi:hypothetical protein